jgi:hypothetical protein
MTDTIFRRPLKIQIQSDDVLFFMHIPKTGGLSLIQLLDTHFQPSEIFPLHSVSSWKELEAFPPEQLVSYRLVRGHFRFGPYDRQIFRYFCQNPLILTMLRDPVARTISAYRYVKRSKRARIHEEVVSRQMSLLDFATYPPYSSRIVNVQTLIVLGVVSGAPNRPDDPNTLSDEATLALAKQKLESFAFFGLTERFEESVRLLHFTFGWPMAEKVPSENVSPVPSARTSIDAAALAAIERKTHLDVDLYAFAEELFEARVQQMQEELSRDEGLTQRGRAWHGHRTG